VLIILAGLPGFGKTTIARELARRLDAIHLRINPLLMSKSPVPMHSSIKGVWNQQRHVFDTADSSVQKSVSELVAA